MVDIPRNQEAEENVLGSILIDSDCFVRVNYILKSDDFFDSQNSVIFKAFENLHSRRERINVVSTRQELSRLKYNMSGDYLNYLVSITVDSLDVEHYAEIVRRMAINRKLIVLSQTIQDEAVKLNPDTNETIGNVTKLVSDFSRECLTADEVVTPERAAEKLYEMMQGYQEHTITISYGFKDLDYVTGGLYPGELTILGADSSSGKTELALNIMENVNNLSKKILFVSAEMGIEGLLERKIARKLKIDVRDLRKGNLDEEQVGQIMALAGEVSEGTIYTVDSNKTSEQIYNLVGKLKEKTGVDVLFVDYLQQLKDTKQGKQRADIEIGSACSTLKSIAVDYKIPVFCISSFNRDYKMRVDKLPHRSDLRGSGEIEYISDNILLGYREQENPDTKNILHVRLDKGRQVGNNPSIQLVWLPNERRYADYYNG